MVSRMGPGEWMNELGQLGLQLPGGVNPKDRLFRCNLWSQDSFITQAKISCCMSRLQCGQSGI